MGGKSGDITFHGLDNINVSSEISIPDPIVTQSTASITTTNGLTLAIPEPIQLDTNSTLNSTSSLTSDSQIRAQTQSGIALDVRPLTLDVCMKLEFGRFPPTCIRQPYQHHFGVTLFGVELLGFNLVGESRIVVEDVHPAPKVIWGGEQAIKHAHRHKHRREQDTQPNHGLHIRLD